MNKIYLFFSPYLSYICTLILIWGVAYFTQLNYFINIILLILLGILPLIKPTLLWQNKSHKNHLFAYSLLLGTGVLFIFTPFHFSNDAIRHIYDGNYLLQPDIDIYQTSPEKLPAILPQKPNHPWLATIYLPVTQLQSMLGAIIHPQYGFRIVYVLLCLLLMGFILRLCKAKQHKLWLSIFFTPAFCLLWSSHHADVQGFLLISLVCLMLKNKNNTSAITTQEFAKSFGLAYLTACLAGLKPEGTYWIVFLSIYFFYINKQKKYHYVFWLLGLCLCLSCQFLFAYMFLWKGGASWDSFLKTGDLFLNWFLAYNPFLELRVFLYERLSPAQPTRPQIFQIYRQQIVSVCVLFCFLLPALRISYHRFCSTSQAQIKNTQTNNDTIYLFLWHSCLIWGLFSIYLAKGSWHPWYLLWILPALSNRINPILTAGNLSHNLSLFLITVIPLFYLPVMELRLIELESSLSNVSKEKLSWSWSNFSIFYGSMVLAISIKLNKFRFLFNLRNYSQKIK